MRKLFPLFILACIVVYIGCGGDDPPPKSEPDPVYRVMAYNSAQAPSMSDPDDAIWDNAAPTELLMTRAGALPQSIASGPKISHMQAITNGGYLYLKVVWGDASNSIWRDGYYVSDTGFFVEFRQYSEYTHGEDQLFIMFDNSSGDGWDAWSWRAASLAPSGLAEDMWFEYIDSFYTYITADTVDSINPVDSLGDTIYDSFEYIVNYDTSFSEPAQLPHFVNDSATSQVPTVGWPNPRYGVSFEPTYVHTDTSDFHDSVLYWTDALHREDTLRVDTTEVLEVDTISLNPDVFDTTLIDTYYNAFFWTHTRGWDINQSVPGYMIDTAAVHRPAADLGSLYEVQCASVYRGQEHTVVMRRQMNTSNADDLNLNADSLRTKVLVADNKQSMFQADTDRSISEDVWIILP